LCWRRGHILDYTGNGYAQAMTDNPTKLRPADPEDYRQCLVYALRFNGRRARLRQADDMMADHRRISRRTSRGADTLS
jgi:hypothetical protein